MSKRDRLAEEFADNLSDVVSAFKEGWDSCEKHCDSGGAKLLRLYRLEKKKAEQLVKFVKWYGTCNHAEHCSMDADPSGVCTCGVENATNILADYLAEWSEGE